METAPYFSSVYSPTTSRKSSDFDAEALSVVGGVAQENMYICSCAGAPYKIGTDMQTTSEQMWVNAAAKVAEELHRGQRDKAGVDYFTGHLSFVASLGGSWQEQVVGYLHDASEDTPCTVEQVLDLLEKEAQRAMPPEERTEIQQALCLLNHHTAPDRTSYIRRIAQHKLARAVKLNDLTHNMDIHRLSAPTEKDYLRLARYREEYNYLAHQTS